MYDDNLYIGDGKGKIIVTDIEGKFDWYSPVNLVITPDKESDQKKNVLLVFIIYTHHLFIKLLLGSIT